MLGELVSYPPLKQEISKLPEPAQAAKDSEKLMTCEELYLTGLHIEQYRHATYRPDPQSPTVWRNLSLAYYNKRHDGPAAREAMAAGR